jgi:(p)ppGpp synthase/HD superfamily hydrolase
VPDHGKECDIAMLLHDAVEAGDVNEKEVRLYFGKLLAGIVMLRQEGRKDIQERSALPGEIIKYFYRR